MLITRTSSLAVIKDLPHEKIHIYTLNDDVAEPSLTGEETRLREIHAKLYFQRSRKDAWLWLGSMNASYKAICENVEFMCGLRCRKVSLEKLLDDLFLRGIKNMINPFQGLGQMELASLPEPEDALDEGILRELASSGLWAEILKDGIQFRPLLRIDNLPVLPEGYELKLSPLLWEDWLPIAPEIKFRPAPPLKLSAFYRVRLAAGGSVCERILKIPTKDMPPERDQEVIRSILDNRQALYDYLAFLLGDNAFRTMWELGEMAGKGASSKGRGRFLATCTKNCLQLPMKSRINWVR